MTIEETRPTGRDIFTRGGLESGLCAVRARQITIERFFRETKPRWRQIAETMYRRWDLPDWFTVDDVEQDMLLAAHKFFWRFERRYPISKIDRLSRRWKRGSMELFVVWNAIHAASKAATIARIGRRPHRGEGRGIPSNYAIPFSRIAREDDEGRGEVQVPVAVTQATHEEDLVWADFFTKFFADKASDVGSTCVGAPSREQVERGMAYRALSESAGDVDAAVSSIARIYLDRELSGSTRVGLRVIDRALSRTRETGAGLLATIHESEEPADVDAALAVIYADPRLRELRHLRAESRKTAGKIVKKAIRDLAPAAA